MSGPLRRMLGKSAVERSSTTSSNYNKRAIPFSLDNEKHVAGLQSIVQLFADPWSLGRDYTRADLANDVSDFFIAVAQKTIIPIPSELYEKAVAPYLKRLEEEAQASSTQKSQKKSKK